MFLDSLSMKQLLSLGTIIDMTWERYPSLLSVSGWLLILAIIETISLLFYPTATTLALELPLTGWEQFGVTLYAFSSLALAPILGLWIFVSLTRLIHMQGGLRRPQTSKAIKEGLIYFLPGLLISVLMILVLIVGGLLGFAPSLFFWLLAYLFKSSILMIVANILIVLGVFAALFINFRWSLHYIMAPYALLMDDMHGKKAMKESRRLVDGRFWSVFLRVAVPKIFFIVIGLIIMWILITLSSLVINVLAGTNIDLFLRLKTIMSLIISVIVAILINPMVVLADVILYKNLKETT